MTSDQSGAQASPAPPEEAKKPPKRRRARVIILVILAVLAVPIIGIAIFHEAILRFLIKREALARGVELEFETMTIGRGWLRLRDASMTLTGVPGFQAKVGRTRVTWEGLFPEDISRIEAQTVVAKAEGSVADLALDFSEWAKDHPDAFRIPVVAVEISAEWRERAGDKPWLGLSGGSLTPAQNAVAFHATGASVEGVSIGPIGGVWASSGGVISLGFGKPSLADAPVRIDIRPKAEPPTADILLRPVTMADLGSPMGLKLPTEKAKLEGTAKITLLEREGKDVVEGTVAMTLHGWIPPHPKELGGLVFGDRTVFGSAFKLSEDRKTVTLSDALVTAGAFKLKGSGSIERKGDYGVARMDMAGAIPCSDVARSAAAAHFGSAAGAFAGGVAKGIMEGSIAVSVKIEADTRDLAGAKITQGVGVGCGIKGLPQIKLPPLPSFKLPAPGELPELPGFGQ